MALAVGTKAPVFQLPSKPGEVVEWNAEKDFSGMVAEKHMEAWEKFAQVLLETNEMTFVN